MNNFFSKMKYILEYCDYNNEDKVDSPNILSYKENF